MDKKKEQTRKEDQEETISRQIELERLFQQQQLINQDIEMQSLSLQQLQQQYTGKEWEYQQLEEKIREKEEMVLSRTEEWQNEMELMNKMR